MDPQSGFRMVRFFERPTKRLEMVGIGNEGGADQLQCAISCLFLTQNGKTTFLS